MSDRDWIPVSERLPEVGDTVLAGARGFVEKATLTFDHSDSDTHGPRWQPEREGREWGLDFYSHWMPLPKPPQ